MVRGCLYKAVIVMILCVFVFSLCNITYGMEFNDDLQKVTLDYYYYEGFGEDRVVQSVKDGSWHILKPDGGFINLKGNYLAYAGMEGKNLNFDDDYYHFIIRDDSYNMDSTQSIYVDKDGLESFVEGPSTWATEEVSKAIENNLVPFEYQSGFTFNIKRYDVVSVEKLDDNYELEGYENFTFVYEKIGDKWVFTDFPTWW